jgi:hypothetical protein
MDKNHYQAACAKRRIYGTYLRGVHNLCVYGTYGWGLSSIYRVAEVAQGRRVDHPVNQVICVTAEDLLSSAFKPRDKPFS